MKESILLSELQNYLAYGLKLHQWGCGLNLITVMNANHMMNVIDHETNYKPLVRPLSELKEEITINGEKFIPINELKMKYGWDYLFYDIYKYKKDFNINELKYASLKQLFLWHFDVFGWIGSGLAISLTDFEKEKN